MKTASFPLEDKFVYPIRGIGYVSFSHRTESASPQTYLSRGRSSNFIMIHLIPTIIGYVGGDISTPFARDNLSKMRGGPVVNPDFPMCLLIEEKKMYTESAIISRKMFRHAYFSEELLNRMFEYLRWSDVFISPGVPPEFALKHRDKDVAFWNYPRIPLDILREEAKTTSSDVVCRSIISNPSLFSEGLEKAEEIIEEISSRLIVSEVYIALSISINIATPLEFFLRKPGYVHWREITINQGKILRGDAKKTVAFLDEGCKSWNMSCWKNISSNPATPISFIKKHLKRMCDEHLRDLLDNTSISFQFWEKNIKSEVNPQTLHILSVKSSTSYSFVKENLPKCSYDEKRMIELSTYNSPVDSILKIVEDGLEDVDWSYISSNRGFWIHLAGEKLTPILESVLLE